MVTFIAEKIHFTHFGNIKGLLLMSHVAWSVCLSVCLAVCEHASTSCAKTAEPIEMPFGG